MIQDRASGVLVAGKLLDQLKDPKKPSPDGLPIDVGGLLDQLDVSTVVADGETTGLRDRLRSAVGSFGKSLLDADGLRAVREAVETLIAGSTPGGGGPPALHTILRRQVGIGISFATTLKNLANRDLAREIPEGMEGVLLPRERLRDRRWNSRRPRRMAAIFWPSSSRPRSTWPIWPQASWG